MTWAPDPWMSKYHRQWWTKRSVPPNPCPQPWDVSRHTPRWWVQSWTCSICPCAARKLVICPALTPKKKWILDKKMKFFYPILDPRGPGEEKDNDYSTLTAISDTLIDYWRIRNNQLFNSICKRWHFKWFLKHLQQVHQLSHANGTLSTVVTTHCFTRQQSCSVQRETTKVCLRTLKGRHMLRIWRVTLFCAGTSSSSWETPSWELIPPLAPNR
jgi:hypothetical protein